ncbi:PEP-CTERM sorting domain-containing protein [Massilia dura]|uniref:PEP-CTERM sorting domain-containing protein n=1 Tax=Pseudoduganella dura TaxID=321982 RepID=A0A6I3XGL6_9BURK|nr:FxDxF family PEP-CTERM protein [Pseudoduganella dura]MUI15627.1 PEP-CTERM sorting domain-containing protein [Pseudoduganella dura]GGY17906.1 hypothetical protein GCM10007386_54480 [Pseudoduganella dura]
MKLQSLVLAAALTGTFGGASAATIDIELKGGPVFWTTHEIGATHTAGAFSDTFTFSDYSAAASYVTGGLVNTATFVSDITFTGATLNGINVSYGNLFAWSGVGFAEKVTGPLTLTIEGFVKAKGSNTASYGGVFTAISAVPEPSTYGMLIGGMGVLAFAARRRKQ